MPIDRFINERKNVWQRLEDLLQLLDRMTLRKLHREEVRELGRIYRRTASDLAIARAESRDPRLINYLNNLVIRAHGRIYRADAQGGQRLRNFFGRDFPRTFRRTWRYTATAFGVFVLFTGIAFFGTRHDPDFSEFAGIDPFFRAQYIENRKHWWERLNDANQIGSSQIFTNNIKVTFYAFALGAVAGVLVGMLMGRSRWAERLLLPIVSVGNPIPGLAYAPLFVIWFGLGNLPAVLLVAFAAAFPIAVNTWSGVRAVKEIWIRAAESMGAQERQLFRSVVLPAALPYVLTGLRLGLARAWRVLVAVEMLTAVGFGLGWLIFGAREFLNTDVMLAGLAMIGIVGLTLEKLVFERLERYTVVRWGMMTQ